MIPLSISVFRKQIDHQGFELVFKTKCNITRFLYSSAFVTAALCLQM